MILPAPSRVSCMAAAGAPGAPLGIVLGGGAGRRLLISKQHETRAKHTQGEALRPLMTSICSARHEGKGGQTSAYQYELFLRFPAVASNDVSYEQG